MGLPFTDLNAMGGMGLGGSDLSDTPEQAPQSPQSPQVNPAQQAQRSGRVKSLLTNYFQSVGENLGMVPSPERQFEKAKVEHLKAQTGMIQQQQKQLVDSVPMTMPDGSTIHVPAATMQKLLPAIIKAQQADKTTSINQQDKEFNEYLAANRLGIQVTRDPATGKLTHRNLTKEELSAPAQANMNLAEARAKALKDAPLKDQGIIDIGPRRVLVNKHTGDILKDIGEAPAYRAGIDRARAFSKFRAENTPFSTFDNEHNLVTTNAAVAIANGYPAASVWNTVFGPTGSTKTQGQAAGAVMGHIDEYKQAIRNLQAKGQLGAVQGRLNDFLTSGYGGDDPDIANFVTTTGLLRSGAVRAHFGAKGGAQILDSFHHMLNTGQEADALIGSVDAIGNFLHTYKDVGTAHPPATSLGAKKFSTTGPNGKTYDFETQEQLDHFKQLLKGK